MADAVVTKRPGGSRLAANLALAALALASLLALLWPVLPFPSSREAPIGAGVVLRTIDDPTALPRVGGVAPDFEWISPSGATRRLSQLRGKTVVVNFWATWCEPCREEMPALDRAAADPTIAVLALDLDESAVKVDEFLETYSIRRLESVLDAGKKVATRYGVVSLPTTFFVGPDGLVRHLEIRGMDDAMIRAGIAKAR